MIAAALFLLQATGAVAGVIRVSAAVTRDPVVELIALDSIAVAPAKDTVLIDQHDLAFLPRSLVVTVGTTVRFRNSDPILHNVFSPLGPDGFDLGTYPQTTARVHRFTEPGEWIVLCHVHPEMVAYISVVGSPWHAVADRDGRFTIAGLPPGRYRLSARVPGAQSVSREVLVAGGRVVEVDIELPPERRRGD